MQKLKTGIILLAVLLFACEGPMVTGTGGGGVPSIPPEARSAVAGQDAAFSVPDTGTTYQWQHDGVDIGLNSPSLVLPTVRAEDAGTYSVTTTSAAAAAAATSFSYSLDVQTARAQSVLVIGGYHGNYVATTSVDKYDPTTNSWTSAASMHAARAFHTCTRLFDGRVLVAGGVTGKDPVTGNAIVTNTAELYNPVTDTWSDAAGMKYERFQHTATLLANGKVLVAGGGVLWAELYDPVADKWNDAGTMNAMRGAHTATVLRNGKVLVAGGKDQSSAELYDPCRNTWTPTRQDMTAVRGWHTATLLYNGKVLVTGGYQSTNVIVNKSAELYDAVTDTWTGVADMAETRCQHSAVLLPDGKVLVTAGVNTSALKSSELYDPVKNEWTSGGDISQYRIINSALMLLASKKVLIGSGGGLEWTYFDIYDPASSPPWSTGEANSSTEDRNYPALVLINN
jgi:N-acetylneuraminic acid mutarotase